MAFEASLCHPEKPKNAKIAQWSENFSLAKFKPSAKQQQTEQFFNFCGKKFELQKFNFLTEGYLQRIFFAKLIYPLTVEKSF